MIDHLRDISGEEAQTQLERHAEDLSDSDEHHVIDRSIRSVNMNVLENRRERKRCVSNQ